MLRPRAATGALTDEGEVTAARWNGRIHASRRPRRGPPAPVRVPPDWTIIVPRDDVKRYARMRQQYAGAPWGTVHLHRRRGAHRHSQERPQVERRAADRRSNRIPASLPRTHRLAHELPGVTVYELVDREAATDWPTCAASPVGSRCRDSANRPAASRSTSSTGRPRPRHRRQLRAPTTPRHLHRGRAHRQPGPHPLHHPGRLSRARPVSALARAAPVRARALGRPRLLVGQSPSWSIADGERRGTWEAWSRLAARAAVPRGVALGPFVCGMGSATRRSSRRQRRRSTRSAKVGSSST